MSKVRWSVTRSIATCCADSPNAPWSSARSAPNQHAIAARPWPLSRMLCHRFPMMARVTTSLSGVSFAR